MADKAWQPKLSVESFQHQLDQFCENCASFAEACNLRLSREMTAESFYKGIWQILPESKQAQAVCDDSSIIAFTYKYNIAKYVPQNAQEYVHVVKQLQHFIPQAYMSLYFKQLLSQHTLAASIISRKQQLLDDKAAAFDLWVTVLKAIASKNTPVHKYALSVMKEIAVFIGSLIIEDNTTAIVVKILNELVANQATSFSSFLFQPSTAQVVELKLLSQLFTEEFSKKIVENDYLLLLAQIPFTKLKETEISVANVRQQVIEPIKNALNIFQTQTHFKLLVTLGKVLAVCAEQYPELLLECILAFTRARWPCKMIVHSILPVFPWSQITDAAVLDAAFRELYHLYNKVYASMTDQEKQAHQNEYVTKFLLPFSGIVAQCYAADAKLQAANFNASFPCTKTLQLIATAFSKVQSTTSNLVYDIAHLLFALGYKSGTTNKAEIQVLGQLRVECCDQLKTLCNESTTAITAVLIQLIDNLSFLAKTQPAAIEGIITMIKAFPLRIWKLSAKDVECIDKLLTGNLVNAQAVPACLAFAARIGKYLVENISWKMQSQIVCFRTLDVFIKYSTASTENMNWVCSILSGTIGYEITKVSDADVAEQFVQKLAQKLDHLSHALRTLLTLGVCDSRLSSESNTSTAQGELLELDVNKDVKLEFDGLSLNEPTTSKPTAKLATWKALAAKHDMQGQLIALSNGSGLFLTVILKKYMQLLARFELVDVQQDTLAVGSIVATHLARDQFFEELNEMIQTNPQDELYPAMLQLWTHVLVTQMQNENCLRLLDNIIREEFKTHRSLKPIVIALKGHTFTQQSIVSLVAVVRFWVAFASLLSHPVQIPPLDTNETAVHQDSYFQGYLSNTESRLKTDCDCALWIAADCAVKLFQLNNHVMSLLYWDRFFTLYFQAVDHYGYNSFPAHMRDRYNKIFAQSAKIFESKNPELYELFQAFGTWSADIIPGKGRFIKEKSALLVPLLTEFEKLTSAKASYRKSITLSQSMFQPNKPRSQSLISTQPSMFFPNMGHTQHLPPNTITTSQLQPQLAQTQVPLQKQNTLAASQFFAKAQAPVLQQVRQSQTNVQQPNVYEYQESIQLHSNQVPQYVQQPAIEQSNLFQTQPYMSRTVANNVPSTDASMSIPKNASDVIAQPLSVPAQIFAKDIQRYERIVTSVNQLVSQGIESVNITELLQECNISKEGMLFELKNSLPIDVLRLMFEYDKTVQVLKKQDEEYFATTKNIYVNAPTSSPVNLRGTNGMPVKVSISSTQVLLSDPQILNKLQENRAQQRLTQKKLHEICESLTILCALIQKATLTMIQFKDTSATLAEKLYISLLPGLLNMSLACKLNQIWYYYASSTTILGSAFIATVPAAQPKLLQTLLKAPPCDEYHEVTYSSYAVPPPQSMQQYKLQQDQLVVKMQQLLQKVQVRPIDRKMLFEAFNPASLIDAGLRTEFIGLLDILSQQEILLTQEELNALCNRFDLAKLFALLAEFPEGKRFTQRDETKLLLSATKNAICHEMLRFNLGNRLLKGCAELAFPYELGSFIKMIMTLCTTGEYIGDDWDTLLLVPSKLAEIKHDVALEWIGIVNSNTPLPGETMNAAIRFVQSIVLKTQLGPYLNRCDLSSKPMETILHFFIESLKEIGKPTSFSHQTFVLFLQALFAIVKDVPILIDRIWELYYHHFAPYIAVSSVAHTQTMNDFMANLPWNSATFHEKRPDLIEQLYQHLVVAPHIVAHVFAGLHWDSVLQETDSAMLCSFCKLYMDVRLVAPSLIPTHVQQYMENLDQYEAQNPIWARITETEFVKAFNGKTLARLVMQAALASDPSEQLVNNATWLKNVAFKLKIVPCAEACAAEIRSIAFLIIKSKVGNVWFLPIQQNIHLLMNLLIPLIQKFGGTNSMMDTLFSCVNSIEFGVTAHIVQNDALLFSNAPECPFEDVCINKYNANHTPNVQHAKMFTKVKGLLLHFLANAQELILNSVLMFLPLSKVGLATQCEILEETLHSYLKVSTSATPRDTASNILSLPSQNIHMHAMMERCAHQSCAILLSVLLHKYLNLALQTDTNPASITNVYCFAMDLILKFEPTSSKDFAMIYLYFLALELMDSQYWNLAYPAVRERTQRFLQYLSCIGTKNTHEWTKKIAKTVTAPPFLQKLMVANNTCLAARAMYVFLLNILETKRLYNISDDGSLLQASSMPLSTERKSYKELESMLKLVRENKAFAIDFGSFFKDLPLLVTGNIDHQIFRDIILKLYPLTPYIARV